MRKKLIVDICLATDSANESGLSMVTEEEICCSLVAICGYKSFVVAVLMTSTLPQYVIVTDEL